MSRCSLVALATGFAVSAPVSAADGKAVYIQTCAACHTTGVAGAPKLEDRAAWAPRLEAGRDGLVLSVLKGKAAMPPKGGNANLSDADVHAVVDYMMSMAR